MFTLHLRKRIMLEISMPISPFFQKTSRWKFDAWPLCLSIKNVGNFHIAAILRLLIHRCHKKRHQKFSWSKKANGYFVFVDGNRHIPTKIIFQNILQDKLKVWQNIGRTLRSRSRNIANHRLNSVKFISFMQNFYV